MTSVDTSSAINELVRLGLTSYEARVYVALTGRDSFTAAQIARLSGVPRQRIYDVLGTLTQKGLASSRPGAVIKYAAADPATAIGRLVAIRRQELAQLESGAAGTIETLTAAYTAGRRHTDPLEYIEVLREPGAINVRFTELQAAVRDEILVFTKPPYAKPPQENVEGLEVARTHHARSIYEYSVFDDPVVLAGVRRFIEQQEEARFVPTLPMKLVIIDESIVMFGMQDPVEMSSPDLTMMVVEHPALAGVLKTAFEAYWQRGVTFDEAARRVNAA